MNDAELVRLASRALVDVANTGMWDHVRDVVAHLFAGRCADDRWIERRLDATRKRLRLAGPDEYLVRYIEIQLDRNIEIQRWETRFADLLDDHPEVTDDLQALLDEIRTTLSGSGGGSGGSDDGGGEEQEEEFYEPPDESVLPSRPTPPLDVDSEWHSNLAEVPERFPLKINDPVSRAIRAAVKPGVLAFNPPSEMTQGREERVEVAISRDVDLLDALVADLQGPGQVQIEQLRRTSPFMEVELRGDAFEIVAQSPPEQILDPTAKWQFDIRPLQAGLQTLTLSVSMQLGQLVPEVPAGARIAVPVLERQIRIRTNLGYGTRRLLEAIGSGLSPPVSGPGGQLRPS